MSRRALRCGVRGALAALALAVPGWAAAAPCSPADAEGARAPVMLEERTGGPVDVLLVGRRYRAIVVQELGIGDGGQPLPETIVVTPPPGVALAPGTDDGRPVYDFSPVEAGTLALGVAWSLELHGGGTCELTGTVSRPVVAPGLVRTGQGRVYRKGRDSDSWALPIVAPEVALEGPVTVAIRLRTGTTTPPPARGPVSATLRLDVDGDGDFRTPNRRTFRDVIFEPATYVLGDISAPSRERTAFLNVLVRVKQDWSARVRVGFSVEVRHGGTVVGGWRAGAVCRRTQVGPSSAMRCRHVSLQQRP
jgi:hypothetical protein